MRDRAHRRDQDTDGSEPRALCESHSGGAVRWTRGAGRTLPAVLCLPAVLLLLLPIATVWRRARGRARGLCVYARHVRASCLPSLLCLPLPAHRHRAQPLGHPSQVAHLCARPGPVRPCSHCLTLGVSVCCATPCPCSSLSRVRIVPKIQNRSRNALGTEPSQSHPALFPWPSRLECATLMGAAHTPTRARASTQQHCLLAASLSRARTLPHS